MPEILDGVPESHRDLLLAPLTATLRKFAKVYGVEESMLVDPGEDRHSVIYRPRKLVANPPGQN